MPGIPYITSILVILRRLVRGAAFVALALVAIWLVRDYGLISRTNVRFANGPVELAGTIFSPRFGGPHPGVVLIHGSGATDRSHVAGHAKWLARNGFSAMAYDKRGTGESGGAPDETRYFDFADLAGDAKAALAGLRAQDAVDAARCGLLAFSQGGWVAPMVARSDSDLRFLAIVSGAVATIAEDRLFERGARLAREGFDENDRREVRAMQLVDQATTRDPATFDRFAALWDENEEKGWFRRVYLSEEPVAADDEYRIWYRTILDHDPLPDLERLDVPIYWALGDPAHDRYAPVALTIERLDRLTAGRAKDYTIASYAGTDHNLEYVNGGPAGIWRNATQHWRGPMLAWMKEKTHLAADASH